MILARLEAAARNPWTPLYFFLLLLGLTTPFHFRTAPYPFIHRPFVDDVAGNILIFLPFGMILSRLPLWIVLLTAGAFSTGMEAIQQWMWRSPSTADIAANVLGAWIGARPPAPARRVFAFLRNQQHRLRMALLAAPFAIIISCWYLAATRSSTTFDNWTPMPVVVANEHEADRPYEGWIYGIQIFDRVVDPGEVSFDDTPARKQQGGPLLFLQIDGNVILGLDDGAEAMSRTPLELPPLFRVEGRALRCDGGRLVLPESAGAAIYRALQGGSTLSIAALVDPDGHPGRRQSRIITMSSGAEERCFTLGLRDSRIVFRVRSPASGPNGRMPQILSGHPLPGRGPRTILCTYDGFRMRAYVDAARVESLILSALIPPSFIGRGLPLTFALACASAALAAGSIARGRSRLPLAAAAALAAYLLLKCLAVDRHYPEIPLLFILPCVLATMAALRAIIATRGQLAV